MHNMCELGIYVLSSHFPCAVEDSQPAPVGLEKKYLCQDKHSVWGQLFYYVNIISTVGTVYVTNVSTK